jgi:hypothetical protein
MFVNVMAVRQLLIYRIPLVISQPVPVSSPPHTA